MVDTYKEKKNKFSLTNNLGCNQESVTGSVIQATGTVEFEDGLRTEDIEVLPGD